ncbi:hypothetical protein ACFOWA_07775 [Pedobacter lithocola]|uniref:Uncharacterized protein n=1 Tax=Pedobacter lithocola TaxID=1908239 RepID=A0ABV8P704_9SPHI
MKKIPEPTEPIKDLRQEEQSNPTDELNKVKIAETTPPEEVQEFLKDFRDRAEKDDSSYDQNRSF